MAKPFLGFGGFCLRSLGLIWWNFLSSEDGVLNNVFIGDSAVLSGQCRASLR